LQTEWLNGRLGRIKFNNQSCLTNKGSKGCNNTFTGFNRSTNDNKSRNN